eukprot:TRINITY_DN17564_c0_g1_i1.p1 TRINITY_DN17564_c0_g1~~TRINITY_DN17564_c0_g1_i1.p1  ORF type:complete len:690 (+),score=129.85 TRINITY_DN17564_c0_g1_i1:33-2102(+)
MKNVLITEPAAFTRKLSASSVNDVIREIKITGMKDVALHEWVGLVHHLCTYAAGDVEIGVLMWVLKLLSVVALRIIKLSEDDTICRVGCVEVVLDVFSEFAGHRMKKIRAVSMELIAVIARHPDTPQTLLRLVLQTALKRVHDTDESIKLRSLEATLIAMSKIHAKLPKQQSELLSNEVLQRMSYLSLDTSWRVRSMAVDLLPICKFASRKIIVEGFGWEEWGPNTPDQTPIVGVLCRYLEDESLPVRRKVLRALNQLSETEQHRFTSSLAFPFIVDGCYDEAADVRRAAVLLISEWVRDGFLQDADLSVVLDCITADSPMMTRAGLRVLSNAKLVSQETLALSLNVVLTLLSHAVLDGVTLMYDTLFKIAKRHACWIHSVLDDVLPPCSDLQSMQPVQLKGILLVIASGNLSKNLKKIEKTHQKSLRLIFNGVCGIVYGWDSKKTTQEGVCYQYDFTVQRREIEKYLGVEDDAPNEERPTFFSETVSSLQEYSSFVIKDGAGFKEIVGKLVQTANCCFPMPRMTAKWLKGCVDRVLTLGALQDKVSASGFLETTDLPSQPSTPRAACVRQIAALDVACNVVQGQQHASFSSTTLEITAIVVNESLSRVIVPQCPTHPQAVSELISVSPMAPYLYRYQWHVVVPLTHDSKFFIVNLSLEGNVLRREGDGLPTDLREGCVRVSQDVRVNA